MRISKLIVLVVGVLFMQCTRIPGQNVATAAAHCLSFQIQPLSRSDPTNGTVSAYFTTYTGADLYPPLHDVSGVNWVFSQEVRPLSGQPGVYGTDYLSVSSTHGLFQYGHILFTFPTTDSDDDCVLDFLQKEKAVNLSFSGVQTAIYPSKVTVNLTGTLTRAAGQVQGQIWFNNGIDHRGNWNIPNLSGTMNYVRSNGVPVRFQLMGVQPEGGTHSWTGGAMANASADKLDLPIFTLTRDDKVTFRMATAFSARRSDSRYIGAFQVVDGLSGTSWADFTNWVLEVSDPCDSNSNGVPDLSDQPDKPRLALGRDSSSETLSVTVQPAHSYTIQRSTDLKTWSFFTNFVSTTRLQQVRCNDVNVCGFYRVRFP
jgi:hypothetical protein